MTSESRFDFRIAALATCLAGCFVLLPSTPASAVEYEGWGVRGGFSADPDQFVFGMHMQLSELAEYLRLTPSIDMGFGDDLTVITLNPDITYEVPVAGAGSFVFGGNLSLIYVKIDSDKFGGLRTDNSGRGGDDDDTDFGVAGIVGFIPPMHGDPIEIDLKIGLTDEHPELKILLSYSFLDR